MVATLGNSSLRLGIDFGSLNIHIALQNKKKLSILTTEQGNRALPTYLTFGNEISIGEVAQQEEKNYENQTIYHIKRFLGRTIKEVIKEEFIKDYPFQLTQEEEQWMVTYGKEKTKITLMDYCTYFFKDIKKRAENYTNEKVNLCVLSFPVFYGEMEKKVLFQAAEKAGLRVLRMIKEPIAACIAYDLDVRNYANNEKETEEEEEDVNNNISYQYAVVMDIGGTRSTFSLIHMERGLLRILASQVYHDLGGEEYTRLLMDYCINHFIKKHSLNLRDSSKALQKLKYACENAKRSLSQQNMARIEVDSIYQNKDLALKISSAQFYGLISSSLSTIQKNMIEFLNQNDLEPIDIEKIIVCGGCAYLPAIQELANQMFPEKEILSQTNPDEVVALGAAIQAGVLADSAEWDLPNEEIQSELSAVPLTLGVKDNTTGSIIPLIMQGSLLPAVGREKFKVTEDGNGFSVEIYQGEFIFADKNELVAVISLKDFFTPSCKKEVIVEMEVTRESNVRLIIKSVNGKSKEFVINNSVPSGKQNGNIKDVKAKIKQMIENAKKVREEELDRLDELEAENQEEVREEQEENDDNMVESSVKAVSKMSVAVEMD